MRLKRNGVLGMMAIVLLTLIAQLFILSALFNYFSPSVHHPRLVHASLLEPKHHPRSLQDFEDSPAAADVSLANMRSVKQSPQMDDDENLTDDAFEETIVQRKKSKEGMDELEKAPKHHDKDESHQDKNELHYDKDELPIDKDELHDNKHELHDDGRMEYEQDIGLDTKEKPPNDFSREFTGLRRATVRYIDVSTTEKRRVLNRPSKKSESIELGKNEELMKNWEKHQLKIIKTSGKLKSLLARVNPIDSYRQSLKIPGLKSGVSIRDYVARIQSLGRSSNLTQFLKDFCSGSGEELLECSNKKMRKLTPHEEQGRNIMFTIRTTKDYHETRLGVMFETWVTTLYPESLFLVTDDEDSELAEQLEEVGMHYINAKSGHTHNRVDLCCKAGVELELMFQPENKHFDWICHVDDDMYVHVPPLARQLSKFDPRTDPVYLGRSGSEWDSPRIVNITSKLGKPGQKYHFAVGGMYCLSRAMLELAKTYLVGCHAFNESCSKTQMPEDVTVGLVTGAVLRKPLTHTQMIWTHGLDLLTSTPSPYIRDMIAFSNGFGAGAPWMPVPNVVFVPGALFSIDEDLTQFKSIHCHIYPTLHWCIDQKRFLVEAREKRKQEGKHTCVCAWETYMCCEIIRSGYFETVSTGEKANAEHKNKPRPEETQNTIKQKALRRGKKIPNTYRPKTSDS